MATYKVLQDIEAEDKFLGPLTLKQFIFAMIAAGCAWLSFFFLTKGVWVVLFMLVPIIIFTGFLAFPWNRDQPTEVWLLAKIRFAFKPRRRIWDQSGLQELVKITAPKAVEESFNDGLSQTEVKSRLRALADTIDSRGWAVKGVDRNTAAQLVAQSSDRLVASSSLPATSAFLPSTDSNPVIDIFESAEAQRLTTQIAASSQSHKDDAVSQMQSVASSNDDSPQTDNFWFMNEASTTAQPGMATFGATQTAPPPAQPSLPVSMRKPAPPEPDEAQILNTLHANKNRSHDSFHNHKSVVPGGAQHRPQNPASSVTAPLDPATIELARNNDRSVESLARETNRIHQTPDDDEVVISLH